MARKYLETYEAAMDAPHTQPVSAITSAGHQNVYNVPAVDIHTPIKQSEA